MRLYLGGFIGTGRDDDGFRPPVTDPFTLIDLRPNPTLVVGRCLVMMDSPPSPLPSGWRDLGDNLDGRLSNLIRTRLGGDLGLTVAADTPRSIIAELLILHGRQDGTRWKPLKANRLNRHRIVMDGIAIFDAPVVVGTVITDNFNRADNTALGSSSEGWSWTERLGDFQILSNEAVKATDANAVGDARAESDLATDDHYAQAASFTTADANTLAGVCVRFDPTARTHYFFWHKQSNNVNELSKYVAGTYTNLATSANIIASGAVLKLQVDGSALEAFNGGVSYMSTTDTAITGFLRTGISGRSFGASFRAKWDNFEAGDLAVPATEDPYPYIGGGYYPTQG